MESDREKSEQDEVYELVDYRKPSTIVTDKPQHTDYRNLRRFKLPGLHHVKIEKKTLFQRIGPKTFAALSLVVLVLVLAGVVALMVFKISSSQLSDEFGILKQQFSNLIFSQSTNNTESKKILL